MAREDQISLTGTRDGLVEEVLAGRIGRRELLRRGSALGFSVGALSILVAACGGGDEATEDTSASEDAAGGEETAAEPVGVIRVATQKPAATLDPVGMQDLGAYGLIAQCLEYLTHEADGDIGPGLATEWSANADASEWSFTLREGVKWHDGSDFTSADVAATFDRLVEFGNPALKGVIAKGSVDSSDPMKVVVKLEAPNGKFPYLVSIFNPQSAITPASFVLGSTLDGTPTGTGPFKLTAYDAATGCTFERNLDWWGGTEGLAGSEWLFFDDAAAMVTAALGGEVDAVVQFQIADGDALFNDPNFVVLGARCAAHREIWMRCDKGTFADKRVRQALAYTVDRPALVETLFKGKADLGNDTVVAPVYAFADVSVPQRERDIEKAKALLAEAGVSMPVKAKLHFGLLQEIPQLAQLLKQQAADAGFELDLAGEDNGTFYGNAWCPAEPANPPCSGATELGIVDYGHRPTPDVYLNAALSTNGVWNSSQYMSPEFDAAFAEYSKATTTEATKAACRKITDILMEDTPIIVPYHYNILSGHTTGFTGVRSTALGHLLLDKAAVA
jgi:peptide/nickel transport system substrate-binding protein